MNRAEALIKVGVPLDCPGGYFGPWLGSGTQWVGDKFFYYENLLCGNGRDTVCKNCPLRNKRLFEVERVERKLIELDE